MLRFTKLLLFSTLLFSNSCKDKSVTIRTNNELRDTIVYVTKDYSLVLNQIKEKRGVVYSNPLIRYKNKDLKLHLDINITKIEQFDFSVSPNKKFMVMHYIANDGYVYMNETDSVYHEVFKSSIISMETGKVLVEELTPLESLGSWDNNNKWVDDSGKILLDPKKL